MTDWTPIRKIVAAALTAALGAGGVLAWLQGTGSLDVKVVIGAIVAAALPVIVGYLTPPESQPRGGEPGGDDLLGDQ